MASSEEDMKEDMSEVVIVTIPDSAAEDLHSEDKAVLVTAELTPQPG